MSNLNVLAAPLVMVAFSAWRHFAPDFSAPAKPAHDWRQLTPRERNEDWHTLPEWKRQAFFDYLEEKLERGETL